MLVSLVAGILPTSQFAQRSPASLLLLTVIAAIAWQLINKTSSTSDEEPIDNVHVQPRDPNGIRKFITAEIQVDSDHGSLVQSTLTA